MPRRPPPVTAQIISELEADGELRDRFVRALGDGVATARALAEQGRILKRHAEALETLTAAVRDQGQRIEEQGRRIEALGERVEAQGIRVEEAFRRVEALGARWGLHSEDAFRQGMRAVLERRFNAKVRRWEGFDPEGVVFGHPASIELYVVIGNGSSLVLEVSSEVSAADLAAFERKAKLYEQQTHTTVGRMVVSPSVDPRALEMAEALGIEVSTRLL